MNKLVIPKEQFHIRLAKSSDIAWFIKNLGNDSSSGYIDIPTIIIKNSIDHFGEQLCMLIYDCKTECVIPDDCKTAVVTPLYKNKGDKDDMNNYRGISVLPPFAKIFKKIYQ